MDAFCVLSVRSGKNGWLIAPFSFVHRGLGLILNVILTILFILSTMLIYSLLMISIETRTFELGVHRMVHDSLTPSLSEQVNHQRVLLFVFVTIASSSYFCLFV